MRIHSLQHVPFEDLAGIKLWADAKGHPVSSTKLYEEATLLDLDAFDCLVVLGGPMSVHDEHEFPWLRQEKLHIEQAIKAQKKIIGICLGSQLVADVLGAKVRRGEHKEIGWFPIELSEAALSSALFSALPKSFPVFHWHGETFDLPAGAVHVASSEACPNQAFSYGSDIVGFQFHLEATPESVERMIRHEQEDMTPGDYVQTADEILSETNLFSRNLKILNAFLDAFER